MWRKAENAPLSSKICPDLLTIKWIGTESGEMIPECTRMRHGKQPKETKLAQKTRKRTSKGYQTVSWSRMRSNSAKSGKITHEMQGDSRQMTCSERLLLSRARYGVLHVLYIVLLPLFSCRTDSMCSRWPKCIQNWQGLRQLTLNWAWIKESKYTQRAIVNRDSIYSLQSVLPRSAAGQLEEAVTRSYRNPTN